MISAAGITANVVATSGAAAGELLDSVPTLITAGAEVVVFSVAAGVVAALVVEDDVVGLTTSGAGDGVSSTTGAAEVVVGASTAAVVEVDVVVVDDDDGVGVGVVGSGEGTAGISEPGPTSEMKLISDLKTSLGLTEQGDTTTISPSTLVTLTVTLSVPKPSLFSKKLYVCLSVSCQVFPPSRETSRAVTSLFAFTTCILNQFAETPSLFLTSNGVVIGHST